VGVAHRAPALPESSRDLMHDVAREMGGLPTHLIEPDAARS
jgi:hypothetical protein